jgi:hypothetical protein
MPDTRGKLQTWKKYVVGVTVTFIFLFRGDGVDYSHWKEPKIVVKILLEYFKRHRDTEILLLFQLLRALCGRVVADFQVGISITVF